MGCVAVEGLRMVRTDSGMGLERQLGQVVYGVAWAVPIGWNPIRTSPQLALWLNSLAGVLDARPRTLGTEVPVRSGARLGSRGGPCAYGCCWCRGAPCTALCDVLVGGSSCSKLGWPRPAWPWPSASQLQRWGVWPRLGSGLASGG